MTNLLSEVVVYILRVFTQTHTHVLTRRLTLSLSGTYTHTHTHRGQHSEWPECLSWLPVIRRVYVVCKASYVCEMGQGVLHSIMTADGDDGDVVAHLFSYLWGVMFFCEISVVKPFFPLTLVNQLANVVLWPLLLWCNGLESSVNHIPCMSAATCVDVDSWQREVNIRPTNTVTELGHTDTQCCCCCYWWCCSCWVCNV